MSLDIKQCDKCGRLFQSFAKRICPACIEEIDRSFVLVRDYLYDKPAASLVEVAQATGVREKLILQFLKEQRLSITETSGLLLCENCSKPISSGLYCAACLDSLSKDLDRATDKLQKEVRTSKSRKMHLGIGRK